MTKIEKNIKLFYSTNYKIKNNEIMFNNINVISSDVVSQTIGHYLNKFYVKWNKPINININKKSDYND